MATLTDRMFGRKPREAAGPVTSYPTTMINKVMNRGEWGILLALALIWGAAFFCIKVAVTHVEPLTYVWLRLSIAAAALWALLRWRGERLRLPVGIWGAILVLAVLNNMIPFVLFGWGQQRIASGLASILNATTPIWGVIAAHLWTRDERITPTKILGVLIGFAGVATMIGPDLLFGGDSLLPQLACLVAAFCYAVAGVWARRFKALGVSPLKVAAAQLAVGAFAMAPLALAIDQPWLDAWPPLEAWAAIVALALVATAFGYVLYFRLIDSAGATNALLVTLLVPPTAILLGALFLKEQLTIGQFGGLAFIALGLALIDGRLLAKFRRKATA